MHNMPVIVSTEGRRNRFRQLIRQFALGVFLLSSSAGIQLVFSPETGLIKIQDFSRKACRDI